MRLSRVIFVGVLMVATTILFDADCLPALTTSPHIVAATLRLPRLFADGMVVQRDARLSVWGWATPNAGVLVSFRGHTARVRATANGAWRLTLPPSRAGGPFELLVRSGNEYIALHNVLVGDVWVASGQSNMEFVVASGNDAPYEIAAAHDSLIRQFKVPLSWANAPEDDLAGGAWVPADSQHVGAFTAVGYFFARDLRKSVHVPIAIINTTWGGSAIEAWMSRASQGLTDSAWSATLRAEDARVDAMRASLRAKIGALPTTDAGLVGSNAVWADTSLDDSNWAEIDVPAFWEPQGYEGMDGVAWYRHTFNLSESEVRAGVTVSLAAIDDNDITWVNGIEIGRTAGYNLQRTYRVPATALRVGRNVLAVRVTDLGGDGGINGAATLEFGDGTQRSLAGRWKFKVGEVSLKPAGQDVNQVPSALYNKMIYPLLPFAIKGVIWYQGETNASNMTRARAYRGQFHSLIESWRGAWGSGRHAFPFLWVQLPNFGAADTVPPATAAWATQRESMDAALSLPKTGRAVAIDVGEPGDIHPRNKQDVGARLARVARRVAYGEKLVSSGPTYRSHTVRGDTVIVQFDNIGGGLVSRAADGAVGGFAIAGADHRFVWANARVVGKRVVVWSDSISKPVAVRYAWANNPERLTLYNRAGLPTAPFRTDRW